MFEGLEKTETKEREVDFESVKEATLEFLSKYEQPEYFIDRGGVGRVYELPDGFCIKILEKRHGSKHQDLLDLGNTPSVEAALQRKAFTLNSVSKTKVPYLFGTVTTDLPSELESEAIIMERLNAVNLQHVIAGEAELPETFDLHDFLKNLETFIQALNEESEIAHKDLYPRNVMVDIESGSPYVIDFGRSVDLSEVSEEERKKHIDEDWRRLDELYEALEYLQNT